MCKNKKGTSATQARLQSSSKPCRKKVVRTGKKPMSFDQEESIKDSIKDCGSSQHPRGISPSESFVTKKSLNTKEKAHWQSKMKFLVVSSCVLGGLLDSLLNLRGGGRVVGGYEVKPAFKYPWMVSLQFENKHSCGGTLFTSNKVITAAHCVFDDIKKFTAKLHRHNLNKADSSENGQTFGIKSRVVHPKYTSTIEGYDISIWTLSDADATGSRARISSVEVHLDPGVLGTSDLKYLAIGWGRIYENGPVAPSLMEVVLPHVSPQDCSNAYKKEGLTIYHERQICAGFLEDVGQDTCQGDSGGPLFAMSKDGPYLIGIVSYGIGCASPFIPGIYTRVSSVSDFIVEKIA